MFKYLHYLSTYTNKSIHVSRVTFRCNLKDLNAKILLPMYLLGFDSKLDV